MRKEMVMVKEKKEKGIWKRKKNFLKKMRKKNKKWMKR
jgi:hypothetical protein